jgi:hypothetical protein
MCASACGLIWIAGTPRMIEAAPVVAIGFHAVYTQGENQQGQNEAGLPSAQGNARVGAYITRLELPYAAVLRAAMSGPNEMIWLTAETAKRCQIAWGGIGARAP